jgi:hypothetical protein
VKVVRTTNNQNCIYIYNYICRFLKIKLAETKTNLSFLLIFKTFAWRKRTFLGTIKAGVIINEIK